MSPESTRAADEGLIGRTLCGCEILGLVGRGGMGTLYNARQLSLDRVVAVKVLSPSLSSNQEFLGRFRREARALANLVHPNIVAIHDFGEQEGIFAIVMEYVEGESVADMLMRSNVIPAGTSLAIIRQVADGLAAAHRREIIHCDLKPENILVTPEGVAKVVDFGLAKSVRGDAMKVTTDGAILGTPTYMSPEQCEGEKLDARTDIYSLGVTLYRMVAGADPFEGENAFAIMLKHKAEAPRDPRDLNPEVPGPVAQLILRMMEKARERRIQTAEDVVKAIDQITEERDAEAESNAAADPRREVAFVREAVESGLVTVSQVRRCLSLHDDLRKAGVEEGFASLMVRQGMLSEQQVNHIRERCEARDLNTRDREFGRLAVERRLVSSVELTQCLQRQQRLRSVGPTVKLSKIMVDEGVLDQKAVVQILLSQLKHVQESEDEEFLRLVRGEAMLSDEDIAKCIAEQARQDAQGYPKLLRQVAIEVGAINADQARSLLRSKIRSDVELFLQEHEHSKNIPQETVIPEDAELKLADTEPCPGCGQPVRVGAKVCSFCGSEVEEARREAARRGVDSLRRTRKTAKPAPKARKAAPAKSTPHPTPTARWEIRLPTGEASRPVDFQALIRLAREGRLRANTVLRGPLTDGVWRQARHTPRLCRLFGVCHYCEEKIPPRAAKCPACGANPDKPKLD